MDGTVVAIVTEEGQTVNANQSAPTIVKLAKLDTMTVKAEISEADVMKVEEGQTVYFTTLGNSEKKHYATLRQVEPAPNSINTETNNTSSSSSTAVYYNALFDVPNDDGKLRIDMTAQVYIVLNEARNVLTVPSSAIQTSNRPQRNRAENNNTATANPEAAKTERTENPRPQAERNDANRPARLELTAAETALVEQGKASVAMVRVLQADGSAKPTQVLIGLNNRANAQVLRGLSQGDQVVIADGSDTSNDSAKRSSRAGGPSMRM
jgi:macrolide-specific efflux system membrane fusion protein